MSDLAVSNVFNAGDIIDAVKFNTNYTTNVAGYINNRNSGSSKWDNFYVLTATTVPLIANNSTGTQDIVNFKDNGTTVFQILDGGYISSNQVFFRAAKITSDQVIDGATPTLITFDSVVQNGSYYSTSTSRFTAPTNGKYFITSIVWCNASTLIATTEIFIYKNGSRISVGEKYIQPTVVTDQSVMANDLISLNKDDYIEIYGIFNAVAQGLAAFDASGTKTFFSAIKVA